jgi:hypothetical protein
MIGNIEPKAYRFAYNYCSKYKGQSLNSFVFSSTKCKTEMIADCLLVQYTENDSDRVFYSIFFDEELWNRKKSEIKRIKQWFMSKNRQYRCGLPNVSSIRLFLGRM